MLNAARDEFHAAAAEVARDAILEVAGKYEGVVGVGYEVEYVYDDEGGYFPSTTMRAYDAANEMHDDASDDLMDHSFDPETLRVLMPEDDITPVEKLKV